MIEAPSDQWITSEKEVIRFTFQNQIFISCYDSIKKLGCAIIFSPHSSLDLKIHLEKAQSFMQVPLGQCEIKIVGPSLLLESVINQLRNANIKLRSVAARELSHFEVLFYPDSGRVRVGSLSNHPSKNSTPAISKDNPVKVLIVDDSVTIRKLLRHVLSQDPLVEVVAAAEKPSEVEGLILKYRPDVLTLDIHMPEMNGVELLKILHPKYLIPTIIISSISLDEGPLVLEALENGAVDYIQKPSVEHLETVAPFLLEKIKAVAKAKLKPNPSHHPTNLPTYFSRADINQELIIAIGSSTGGTEALREVLTRLPAPIPPILIVQHIPPVFSLAFAKRMNDLCPFNVKEGSNGDLVQPGQVLIAPGGKQMTLVRDQQGLRISIDDSPPVNRHRPSVDVLFDSVAEIVKEKSVGVILTGMGADGAKGLLKMRQAGAHTLAQDEESCVVFGMPREAIRLGAVDQGTPLSKIPDEILSLLMNMKRQCA